MTISESPKARRWLLVCALFALGCKSATDSSLNASPFVGRWTLTDTLNSVTNPTSHPVTGATLVVSSDGTFTLDWPTWVSGYVGGAIACPPCHQAGSWDVSPDGFIELNVEPAWVGRITTLSGIGTRLVFSGAPVFMAFQRS